MTTPTLDLSFVAKIGHAMSTVIREKHFGMNVENSILAKFMLTCTRPSDVRRHIEIFCLDTKTRYNDGYSRLGHAYASAVALTNRKPTPTDSLYFCVEFFMALSPRLAFLDSSKSPKLDVENSSRIKAVKTSAVEPNAQSKKQFMHPDFFQHIPKKHRSSKESLVLLEPDELICEEPPFRNNLTTVEDPVVAIDASKPSVPREASPIEQIKGNHLQDGNIDQVKRFSKEGSKSQTEIGVTVSEPPCSKSRTGKALVGPVTKKRLSPLDTNLNSKIERIVNQKTDLVANPNDLIEFNKLCNKEVDPSKLSPSLRRDLDMCNKFNIRFRHGESITSAQKTQEEKEVLELISSSCKRRAALSSSSSAKSPNCGRASKKKRKN